MYYVRLPDSHSRTTRIMKLKNAEALMSSNILRTTVDHDVSNRIVVKDSSKDEIYGPHYPPLLPFEKLV